MCNISVIIPVYNAEQYLNRCIESVVNQSCRDIEIILIDDGSKDSSAIICKHWQKIDSRVKFFSKSNGGVSSARNAGINLSQGKFLTFIDSDDYIDVNYCELLMSKMKDDIDLVAMGAYSVMENTVVPIKHRLRSGLYCLEDLKHHIVDDGTMSGFTLYSSCAILYRNEIIQKGRILFRENIKYSEDGLFNTEYIYACMNNVYIDYNNYIYYYRVNMNSATHTIDVLSEKYNESQDNVNIILEEYNIRYPQYDISRQISARYITLKLSEILCIVDTNQSLDRIKNIIKSHNFRNGLRYLNFRRMNRLKKAMYLLLKIRNASLIMNVLRSYINPRR